MKNSIKAHATDAIPNRPLQKTLVLLTLIFSILGCSKVAENTTVLFGTLFDLRPLGYQSKEFFIEGTAHSYLPVGELSSDGQWQAVEHEQADYLTRIVVKRPIKAEDFNGTVVVEWNNVTGNTDAPAEWSAAHTEFIREGYAWVGVSAQRKGIDNVGDISLVNFNASLKALNPARYDKLVHPGDSFSYSMFHQIAEKIRAPEDVDYLQGLQVQRMIGAGESQSAARMITYINLFGKTEGVFDGFFVHSRFGSSAPVSESPLPEALPPAIVKIREDLYKPVMLLQTETDQFVESFLPSNAYENRQDDTEYFRLWEVAGTAHADTYNTLGLFDRGVSSYYAQLVSVSYAIPLIAPCDAPVNGNPIHHFTVNAAFHALDTWLRSGVAPTIADRLAVAGSPPQYVTDEYGNTLGGIRSPYVDAPLARFGGIGSGSIMCMIFGSMEKFSPERLAEMYASRDDYLLQVEQSIVRSLDQGFLRPADAEKIRQASRTMSKTIPE
ncbi:MAG: alpha/beta hydrolase domain-containing protein [Pseudomonadota bacterium]|nr:alpha/beta hydrolase domain-containing protein [Pseudomonadota bacterium]